MRVVGLFLESQTATVLQVVCELLCRRVSFALLHICCTVRTWIGLAQLLDWSAHLLLTDLLVFLPLCRRLEPLPWQGTTVEVHEDVAERFQVVSSRLLYAHVRVDRCVARGASEILQ